MKPAERQPFSCHLAELRSRLFSIGILFLLGSILGFLLHRQLLDILVTPLSQSLYYSSPAGGFDLVIRLSLLVGLALSIPVGIFHLIRFVEPAFSSQSPRKVLIILFCSCALLIAGALFAYFVSLPPALRFLNRFQGDGVEALISANDYISFVGRYLLGFGLFFQLPLIILLVNSIRPIPVRDLLQLEKWVVLIAFLLAGLLTPTPDIFNQVLMALPLIFLYQLTVLLLILVNARFYPKPTG